MNVTVDAFEASGTHCTLSILCRAGASGPVGPVLAGPISVRKRGRVKFCTNAIVSVSMRKRRRTHTHVY